MDLHIRQYITKAQHQKDPAAVKKAYDLIKDGTKEKTSSDTRCFCPELYVLCAEQATQLGRPEIAEDCLMMYLEGKPAANQFLYRAYLCQGQLRTPPIITSLGHVEEAVACFLKAIELSKEKPRYHFLVFNASLLYVRTVRPLLRPGQSQHLVASLTRVVKALEEVQEMDYSWRAELMLYLVECLVDAGKSKEAASFAKVTSDFIETRKSDFYPKIFSLQVRHKLIDVSKVKKQASPTLSAIYKMQSIKHLVESSEGRIGDPARLKEIFLLLTQSPSTQSPASSNHSLDTCPDNSSAIPLALRIEYLLELGYFALQTNHHPVAADCLHELRCLDGSSTGQAIMMECMECELDLPKHRGKIEDYSKSSVEARLAVIGRLDALLQGAQREADMRALQAVCATQWNVCLPLLQHNLRRSLKKPLLRLAQALEDTHSMLLETRCQIHAELAAIEEEEERLESALQHLQKALSLDQGGLQGQRLQTSLHLLQLRASLYSSPSREEDRAAMLILQAKEGTSGEKRRPMLVSAGTALAPDAFQTVLDADSRAKESNGQSVLAQHATRAQRHTACVKKADGHLTRQGDGGNNKERVRLWVMLVKAARKQEVWDVCRAACRFCLLYDGRRTATKTEGERKGEDSPGEGNHGDQHTTTGRPTQCEERELMRLLAEVHFINGEATIHKLRSEGVELNGPAVPPDIKGTRPPEDDPQWILYRRWIQELSDYATSSFLRGAELGAELRETCMVANAAVYLWNYNREQLANGHQPRLLPAFSRLVELLRQTGHTGDSALQVLLCDAVAKGLTQPWCVTQGRTNQECQFSGRGGSQQHQDKTKKSGGRAAERAISTHGLPLDAAALQDIRKALELCEYALRLSNGNGETVSILVRKQIIATWVNTKRLLQQQIGQKLDCDEESKNETVAAMTRILVAVEMLLCNANPRFMEFTVPSLSALVLMTAECRWSDPVIELHVWTQLAQFAHQSADHDLVMTCTHNALQLERAASQRAKVATHALSSSSAVQELLSGAACVRGLSMLHRASGHPSSYRLALSALQTSVSYAAQAGCVALCMAAARHYWNACLPLLATAEDRRTLWRPLEDVLSAINLSMAKPGIASSEGSKEAGARVTQSLTSTLDNSEGRHEDDVALRAALYGALVHIHMDSGDWRQALRVLERALQELPRTPHRLLLYKQRVLVKARLGESLLMDMQRVGEEGELHCARLWHRVALGAGGALQQLACYQNTIAALQGDDAQLQRAEYLLEFGEWLYLKHFPVADVQMQIHWAIDILLFFTCQPQDSSKKTVSKDSKLGGRVEVSKTEEHKEEPGVIPVSCMSQVGVQGVASGPRLSELRDIRRLDGLVRAHALLAIMEDRTSPKHQQCLLLAYGFIQQIWQVSMATTQEVIRALAKNPPVTPAQPHLSATSKKDKEKEKGRKTKEPPAVEEKPAAGKLLELTLPSGPEGWAGYSIPEDMRQVFRTCSGPHCLNTTTISMQTRTLYFLDLLVRELESISLTPLTLAPLHLAEVIAHDLANCKSLSDLYRLRMVRSCCELGLGSVSPYHDKLMGLTRIHETEHMECRKAVILQRDRRGNDTADRDSGPEQSGADNSGLTRRRVSGPRIQEVWLDKAEICLGLGYYSAARHLLAESHLMAKELDDQVALAKSLHLLAILANQEQNYSQSLALLEQAQDVGGDEDFWYGVTLSLLRATVEQGCEDADAQVCQITERACGVFRSALEQRPNRAKDLSFFIASLETTGAAMRMRLLTPAQPGMALSAEAVQKLTAACHTLAHCTSQLLQLGHTTHAAETMLQHSHTLSLLARHATDKEEKQRHLLEALALLQQAVAAQESVVLKTLSVLPAAQSGCVSLPAVRACERLRLALAELAVRILEAQCVEEKQRARAQDRKPSIQRAVEEYIRSSSDLSTVEREWLSVGQTLAQTTISHLCAINTHSCDRPEVRARTLGLLGKCLRLLALQKDPLYPSTLWEVPITQDELKEEMKTVESEANEQRADDETAAQRSGSNQRVDLAKSSELQKRRCAAQQYLAQASETLAQAVCVGLQAGLPHLLSQACADLLECHGQLDPSASGQYLALLQTSVFCVETAALLRSACVDGGDCGLAALLGLQRSLEVSQGETPGPLWTTLHHALNSCSRVYAHMSVSPNHLSFLAELPPSLKVLLLQHSADGSVIYGGFYERSKPTDSQKGKPTNAAGSLVCSRVAKASVSPATMRRLQDKARAFRRHAANTLLEESRRHGNTDPHGRQRPRGDTDVLFSAVVKEMEEYIGPLLGQFDLSCFRPAPSAAVTEAARPKDKEERGAQEKTQPASSPVEHGECVVLLADRTLLELPLEALAVLQGEGISSMARDFSLQTLHGRLQRNEAAESDLKKDSKGGKGGQAKGEHSKAIKAAPASRVLPPHTLPVDTHNIKYIVDPYGDAGEFEGSRPTERMRKILEAYEQHLTPLRDGVMGSEHSPSLPDLERVLTSCSAFIFYGTERFLSNISPSKLATLNLSECRMAVLVDLEQSGASSLRQSRLDLHKSEAALALEDPLQTAALLSLSGVGSVLLNQWACSARTNAQNMDSVMESLLKTGLTSGQTVHVLRKSRAQNLQTDGNAAGQLDAVGSSLGSSAIGQKEATLSALAFNFVIYGLPNLVVT